MSDFVSLWDEASRDMAREASLVSLTAARVAAAPVWPFLASARNETDLALRFGLAEERLSKAAGGDDEVRQRLIDSLHTDWQTHHAARTAASVARCANCGHALAEHAQGNPCDDCGCRHYVPAAVGKGRRASKTYLIVQAAFGDDDDEDKDSDESDDDSGDSKDSDGGGDDSGDGEFYVVDKDSGKDIGGPYATKADAAHAISSGDFDEDAGSMKVQKGDGDGGSDDGGDSSESSDDGSDDSDDDSDSDGDKKNPFAKNSNKYIKQQGDKWVITQKGTGKVLSHHDSQEEAEASFRAMMQSKHGSVRHTAPGGGEHGGYHLEKSDGGYYVVNHIGERKNNKAMPHEKALKYQRALMVNVPGAKEDAEKHEEHGDKPKHSSLHPVYALEEGEDPLEWIEQTAPGGQGEPEKAGGHYDHYVESARQALAAAFAESGLDFPGAA